MKHASTFFLKTVTVLIAASVLGALIRFPQTEGRAANLDLLSIYADPLIIYCYLASIPFFVGIFQVLKLLGFMENNTIFSQAAVMAVKNIKACALISILFIVIAMGWIRLTSGNDDPAGAMALGIGLTFVSAVIATASDVFQKLLQKAVKLHSKEI